MLITGSIAATVVVVIFAFAADALPIIAASEDDELPKIAARLDVDTTGAALAPEIASVSRTFKVHDVLKELPEAEIGSIKIGSRVDCRAAKLLLHCRKIWWRTE